jgi:hypothetical protein
VANSNPSRPKKAKDFDNILFVQSSLYQDMRNKKIALQHPSSDICGREVKNFSKKQVILIAPTVKGRAYV